MMGGDRVVREARRSHGGSGPGRENESGSDGGTKRKTV